MKRFQPSALAKLDSAISADEDAIFNGRDQSSEIVAIDPARHQVEIGMALQRVTSHEIMRKSPKLQAFLTYIVSETLAGRGERLKAYSIAVTALGKHSAFDPAADPIVRVEASRLRRSLDIYYASEGKDDPIRITLPTGSYQPLFARSVAVPKIVRAVQNFERRVDNEADDFSDQIPTPDDILSARRGFWDDVARFLTPRMPRLILIANTGMMVFMILFGFKVLFAVENMNKRFDKFQQNWERHLTAQASR